MAGNSIENKALLSVFANKNTILTTDVNNRPIRIVSRVRNSDKSISYVGVNNLGHVNLYSLDEITKTNPTARVDKLPWWQSNGVDSFRRDMVDFADVRNDKVMPDFSKYNIERHRAVVDKQVAQNVISNNRYQGLPNDWSVLTQLEDANKLANDNRKAINVDTIKKNILNSYAQKQQAAQDQYDKWMSNAKTQSQRDLHTADFNILRNNLQQEMYETLNHVSNSAYDKVIEEYSIQKADIFEDIMKNRDMNQMSQYVLANNTRDNIIKDMGVNGRQVYNRYFTSQAKNGSLIDRSIAEVWDIAYSDSIRIAREKELIFEAQAILSHNYNNNIRLNQMKFGDYKDIAPKLTALAESSTYANTGLTEGSRFINILQKETSLNFNARSSRVHGSSTLLPYVNNPNSKLDAGQVSSIEYGMSETVRQYKDLLYEQEGHFQTLSNYIKDKFAEARNDILTNVQELRHKEGVMDTTPLPDDIILNSTGKKIPRGTHTYRTEDYNNRQIQDPGEEFGKHIATSKQLEEAQIKAGVKGKQEAPKVQKMNAAIQRFSNIDEIAYGYIEEMQERISIIDKALSDNPNMSVIAQAKLKDERTKIEYMIDKTSRMSEEELAKNPIVHRFLTIDEDIASHRDVNGNIVKTKLLQDGSIKTYTLRDWTGVAEKAVAQNVAVRYNGKIGHIKSIDKKLGQFTFEEVALAPNKILMDTKEMLKYIVTPRIKNSAIYHQNQYDLDQAVQTIRQDLAHSTGSIYAENGIIKQVLNTSTLGEMFGSWANSKKLLSNELFFSKGKIKSDVLDILFQHAQWSMFGDRDHTFSIANAAYMETINRFPQIDFDTTTGMTQYQSMLDSFSKTFAAKFHSEHFAPGERKGIFKNNMILDSLLDEYNHSSFAGKMHPTLYLHNATAAIAADIKDQYKYDIKPMSIQEIEQYLHDKYDKLPIDVKSSINKIEEDGEGIKSYERTTVTGLLGRDVDPTSHTHSLYKRALEHLTMKDVINTYGTEKGWDEAKINKYTDMSKTMRPNKVINTILTEDINSMFKNMFPKEIAQVTKANRDALKTLYKLNSMDFRDFTKANGETYESIDELASSDAFNGNLARKGLSRKLDAIRLVIDESFSDLHEMSPAELESMSNDINKLFHLSLKNEIGQAEILEITKNPIEYKLSDMMTFRDELDLAKVVGNNGYKAKTMDGQDILIKMNNQINQLEYFNPYNQYERLGIINKNPVIEHGDLYTNTANHIVPVTTGTMAIQDGLEIYNTTTADTIGKLGITYMSQSPVASIQNLRKAYDGEQLVVMDMETTNLPGGVSNDLVNPIEIAAKRVETKIVDNAYKIKDVDEGIDILVRPTEKVSKMINKMYEQYNMTRELSNNHIYKELEQAHESYYNNMRALEESKIEVKNSVQTLRNYQFNSTPKILTSEEEELINKKQKLINKMRRSNTYLGLTAKDRYKTRRYNNRITELQEEINAIRPEDNTLLSLKMDLAKKMETNRRIQKNINIDQNNINDIIIQERSINTAHKLEMAKLNEELLSDQNKLWVLRNYAKYAPGLAETMPALHDMYSGKDVRITEDILPQLFEHAKQGVERLNKEGLILPEAMKKLHKYMGSSILVGVNIADADEWFRRLGLQNAIDIVKAKPKLQFTEGLINTLEEMLKHRNPLIDVMPIFSMVYPNDNERNLEHMANTLGVNTGTAHRAIDDVNTTANVLEKVMNQIPNNPTIEDIISNPDKYKPKAGSYLAKITGGVEQDVTHGVYRFIGLRDENGQTTAYLHKAGEGRFAVTGNDLVDLQTKMQHQFIMLTPEEGKIRRQAYIEDRANRSINKSISEGYDTFMRHKENAMFVAGTEEERRVVLNTLYNTSNEYRNVEEKIANNLETNLTPREKELLRGWHGNSIADAAPYFESKAVRLQEVYDRERRMIGDKKAIYKLQVDWYNSKQAAIIEESLYKHKLLSKIDKGYGANKSGPFNEPKELLRQINEQIKDTATKKTREVPWVKTIGTVGTGALTVDVSSADKTLQSVNNIRHNIRNSIQYQADELRGMTSKAIAKYKEAKEIRQISNIIGKEYNGLNLTATTGKGLAHQIYEQQNQFNNAKLENYLEPITDTDQLQEFKTGLDNIYNDFLEEKYKNLPSKDNMISEINTTINDSISNSKGLASHYMQGTIGIHPDETNILFRKDNGSISTIDQLLQEAKGYNGYYDFNAIKEYQNKRFDDWAKENNVVDDPRGRYHKEYKERFNTVTGEIFNKMKTAANEDPLRKTSKAAWKEIVHWATDTEDIPGGYVGNAQRKALNVLNWLPRSELGDFKELMKLKQQGQDIKFQSLDILMNQVMTEGPYAGQTFGTIPEDELARFRRVPIEGTDRYEISSRANAELRYRVDYYLDRLALSRQEASNKIGSEVVMPEVVKPNFAPIPEEVTAQVDDLLNNMTHDYKGSTVAPAFSNVSSTVAAVVDTDKAADAAGRILESSKGINKGAAALAGVGIMLSGMIIGGMRMPNPQQQKDIDTAKAAKANEQHGSGNQDFASSEARSQAQAGSKMYANGATIKVSAKNRKGVNVGDIGGMISDVARGALSTDVRVTTRDDTTQVTHAWMEDQFMSLLNKK